MAENFYLIYSSMQTIAKKYKTKTPFFLSDVNTLQGKENAQFFGLNRKDIPSIRIQKTENGIKYFKPHQVSMEETEVEKFIQDYLNNNLEPYVPVKIDSFESEISLDAAIKTDVKEEL